MQDNYDVIIAGGGLAGLTAANILAKNNLNVLLIEKNKYPFHKVCGEYISNEVLEILQQNGLSLESLKTSNINELYISSGSGRMMKAMLPLGGFGVSRYKLDDALFKLAEKKGAKIIQNTKVQDISFENNRFSVLLNTGAILHSKIVIGSYGKRDLLDKKLNRNFIKRQTGYMAVKYHIKINYPENKIGLYLFKNGYCGISRIEDGKYTLCYLTKRSNMEGLKSVKEMEEQVLYKNKELREIFINSEFLFSKPEVINEISFARKSPVENHILMCGDTAGLITPLCGNGIAMAIQAAKMVCDILLKYNIDKNKIIRLEDRASIELEYSKKWKGEFESRLLTGKVIQSIFNNTGLQNMIFPMLNSFPGLRKKVIERTHGKEKG